MDANDRPKVVLLRSNRIETTKCERGVTGSRGGFKIR